MKRHTHTHKTHTSSINLHQFVFQIHAVRNVVKDISYVKCFHRDVNLVISNMLYSNVTINLRQKTNSCCCLLVSMVGGSIFVLSIPIICVRPLII